MEKTKIYKDGVQYEVDPTSLPAATAVAKGAVKQGEGVAKLTERGTAECAERINSILSSLRANGVLNNDKFVLIYEPNYTEDFDDDWYYDVVDDNIYTAGQSATVKFRFDKYDDPPYRSGYDFIGWALTPDAQTPDFPYDESDPQTYAVTFVDNDIKLYAMWQVHTCTLTYSLGSYGQGSVPAVQTVPIGTEVQVSFSPAPTVNDGSGRAFVGWSTSDGENDYSNANYTEDNVDSLTMYDDVTLYPVFCAQYTLTYALGNDGTGNVPSSQTGYNGQMLNVDFYPAPTCVSDPTKTFVGWNDSDESSSPRFYPNEAETIVITWNTTLYPVFAAAPVQEEATLEVVNNSSYDVFVKQAGTTLGTITSNSSDTITLTNLMIDVEINCYSDVDAYYNGTYKALPYENEGVGYNSKNSAIQDPVGNHYWSFDDEDDGTLTVRDQH